MRKTIISTPFLIKTKETISLSIGISAESIGDDGLSNRVKRQIRLYNTVVGKLRFFGKILILGIKGRKRAEETETKFIDAYKEKNGRKPRGNS